MATRMATSTAADNLAKGEDIVISSNTYPNITINLSPSIDREFNNLDVASEDLDVPTSPDLCAQVFYNYYSSYYFFTLSFTKVINISRFFKPI